MRKKIALIVLVLLIFGAIFIGSSQAGGDNNRHNNGENGNYEIHNKNPFPGGTFPGQHNQKRAGVIWS